MKKIISCLVLLGLCANLSLPVFAADRAEGITIRLAKSEGDDVTITTSTGKEIEPKKNMRVFSGYGIKTGKASYVHLSLDSKKAVKLDQNSVAEIKKAGDTKEIFLSSGALFFDIKEKLKEKEELKMVTSSMTMGVRGTSGVIIENTSLGGATTHIIQIYDGSVLIEVANPDGSIQQVPVGAGQQLDLKGEQGGQVDLQATPILLENIPSVAAEEILKDPDLGKRIEKEAKITPNDIKNSEGDRKAKEETAQKALDDKAQKEQAAIKDQEARPTPAPDTGSGGGDSGGGDSGGGDSDGGDVEMPPLEVATEASLLAALGNAAVQMVIIPDTASITTTGALTIGAEKYLQVAGGLTLGAAMTIEGRLEVATAGSLQNQNTLTVGAGGKLLIASTFINDGTVTGEVVCNTDALVTNNAGKTMDVLKVDSKTTSIANAGTITKINLWAEALTLTGSGVIVTLTMEESAENLTTGSTITSLTVNSAKAASITNSGTVDLLKVVKTSLGLTNTGSVARLNMEAAARTLTTTGTITDLKIEQGLLAEVTNAGTITTLTVQRCPLALTNNGTVANVIGLYASGSPAQLTLTVKGTITGPSPLATASTSQIYEFDGTTWRLV